MFGYHQIKDVLRKKKWILLIVVLTIGIFFLHGQYFNNIRNSTTEWINSKVSDVNNILTESAKSKDEVKHYDVLLSSYMRSGSSLAGIILGYRDDAFYVYEPLWKISKWTYWHGNNSICRSDKLECRKSGSFAPAIKILKDFFECRFDDFRKDVYEKALTVNLGGQSWRQVDACIRKGGDTKLCLDLHAPRLCRNATHRVTKVLRLTTDLLQLLLEEKSDLKVVHLFRDPRAIMNSRITTSWYELKKVKDILKNAKSLCKKMEYDFTKGKELLKLYPSRFTFIYYEDLTTSPLEKAKSLYRYLGMSLDVNRYSEVKSLSIFNPKAVSSAKGNNTAYWWRMSLDWDIVQKMNSICGSVYKDLGYRTFETLDQYTNLSYASFYVSKG